jgi:fission process protein 1
VFFAVCCDVGYHVYQETNEPEDKRDISRCLVHNTVFQLIASLALPAFIIHTGVHQAQRSFKKMGRYTKWGPTVVGLAMIPFLPPLVDYPAEVVIDTGFAYAWPHPVRYLPARPPC